MQIKLLFINVKGKAEILSILVWGFLHRDNENNIAVPIAISVK